MDIWRIKDGTSFSVRCYDLEISKSDETDKLKIVMTGTLDIDNLKMGD